MNENLSLIYSAIDATKKAISDGDKNQAEKCGWELCNCFEENFVADKEEDYTPELCRLQLDALVTLLDLHIMRGDPLDISARFGQLLKKFKMDVEHFTQWTDAEKKPLAEVVARAIRNTQNFFTGQLTTTHKPLAEHPGQCKCFLCKKKPANKKGSHMVPHLLIAETISYDGSMDREKVVVDVDNLSEGNKEYFFGHEVYDDTVNKLLGHSFSDEEIEEESKKVNALTRDYVFCKECEERFGVIETYYSQILEKKIKEYPPEIPYLFWMSVVWRMSVGQMGCKLERDHEEKLRKVLDKCLALKREDIVIKKSKLGYCAYSLYKASDTRDETLGIFGHHVPTKPYQALMGPYLINYYTSLSAARTFCKQHDLPVEDLNNGQEKEKIGELSFIDFWSVKRRFLDMIWKHDRSVWNLGKQEHQLLSRYERDDKKEIAELFDLDPNEAEETTIPAWINSENPNAVVYPRSIRKILLWMKRHDNKIDIKEMSKDTGYSPEEICVMLDYFDKYIGRLVKMEERQRKSGKIIEDFLDYL